MQQMAINGDNNMRKHNRYSSNLQPDCKRKLIRISLTNKKINWSKNNNDNDIENQSQFNFNKENINNESNRMSNCVQQIDEMYIDNIFTRQSIDQTSNLLAKCNHKYKQATLDNHLKLIELQEYQKPFYLESSRKNTENSQYSNDKKIPYNVFEDSFEQSIIKKGKSQSELTTNTCEISHRNQSNITEFVQNYQKKIRSLIKGIKLCTKSFYRRGWKHLKEEM